MGDTFRLCMRILQIHKIEKYKTPSYLRDKVPPHRRPLYRLNNSNTFQEIRCKTARYKNSFFPNVTNSWNNMISNFQDIPTFTGLKSHLLSLIRPKIKSTFGIHDASRLRYLFQLMVILSPLRSHNFSDTPSETCECNLGIEDIRHFLFECPFYAIQRVTLAVNVIDIFQRKNLSHLGNQPELYLYDPPPPPPPLDLINNRQIILSTIKYVKDTTRFSTSVT